MVARQAAQACASITPSAGYRRAQGRAFASPSCPTHRAEDRPTAPDRVQRLADNAEVETLRKEVWRLKDKLDQLAIFLVKEPPPKAENRPVLNDIQRAARIRSLR